MYSEKVIRVTGIEPVTNWFPKCILKLSIHIPLQSTALPTELHSGLFKISASIKLTLRTYKITNATPHITRTKLKTHFPHVSNNCRLQYIHIYTLSYSTALPFPPYICISRSTVLHIFISSYLHIFISSYLHTTFMYQHANTQA